MHLVVCIGNEARGDDGAAREVARRLAGVPGLRVLSEPQLDVVMAEEVATADRVTFVDAERRHAPPLRAEPVRPGSVVSGVTTHALDPAGLLGLARVLYGAAPPAEILTLAAPDMEHGMGLSPVGKAAVDAAVRRLGGGEG